MPLWGYIFAGFGLMFIVMIWAALYAGGKADDVSEKIHGEIAESEKKASAEKQ